MRARQLLRGLTLLVLAAPIVLLSDGASAQMGNRYVDAGMFSTNAVTTVSYAAESTYSTEHEENWSLFDDFDDLNGTTLTRHSTQGVWPWSTPTGGDYVISDGGAAPQGAGAQVAIAPSFAEKIFDIDLQAVVDPNGVDASVVFGADDALDTYYSVDLLADGTLRMSQDMPAGYEAVPPVLPAPVTGITWSEGPMLVDVNVGEYHDGGFGWGGFDVAVTVKDATTGTTLATMNGDANTLSIWEQWNTHVGMKAGSPATFESLGTWRPLLMDLVTPVETDPEPAPRAAVVFVHGGGLAYGDRSAVTGWVNDFASRGYVTAGIDYRLGNDPAKFALTPANASKIVIDGANNGFTLTIDDDADAGTTTDQRTAVIPAGASLTQIRDLVNAALLGAGLHVGSVNVWAGWDGSIWLNWYAVGPRGAVNEAVSPSLSATSGVTNVTATSYTTLESALLDSPACLEPPPFTGFASGPLGAGDCWSSVFYIAQRCGIEFGEEDPAGVVEFCAPALGGLPVDSLRMARHDAQSAIRYLKAHASEYNIDPSRIFIAGGSAGGAISMDVALRSAATGETAEDLSGPYASGSIDAVVAGAAPDGGGANSVDLPGWTRPSTPPIALFEWDLDAAVYVGHQQTSVVNLLEKQRAAGMAIEYHGRCGVGHMNDVSAIGTDVARFFASIISPSSAEAERTGLLSGRSNATFATLKTQQPISPNGADHEVIVGNFDGENGDDLYFHDPAGQCDTLWLGQPNGSFAPTPVWSPDTAKPYGATYSGPVIANTSTSATPIAGDFDGDDDDDIFWVTPGDPDDTEVGTMVHAVWYSRASFVAGTHPGTGTNPASLPGGGLFDVVNVSTPDNLLVAAAGNFGNQGSGCANCDDLLLVDPSGVDLALYGRSTQSDPFLAQSIGAITMHNDDVNPPTTVAMTKGFESTGEVQMIVGDYDGDTRDDVVFYGPGWAADGRWFGGEDAERFYWRSWSSVNGVKYAFAGNFGMGRVPSPADQCAPGGPTGAQCRADDLFMFEVSGSGYDTLNFGHDTRAFYARWLGTGYVPTNVATVHKAAGDFNADGWDDILWYGEGADDDRIWYGSRYATQSVNIPVFTIDPSIDLKGDLRPTSGNFDLDPLDAAHDADDIYFYNQDNANGT